MKNLEIQNKLSDFINQYNEEDIIGKLNSFDELPDYLKDKKEQILRIFGYENNKENLFQIPQYQDICKLLGIIGNDKKIKEELKKIGEELENIFDKKEDSKVPQLNYIQKSIQQKNEKYISELGVLVKNNYPNISDIEKFLSSKNNPFNDFIGNLGTGNGDGILRINTINEYIFQMMDDIDRMNFRIFDKNQIRSKIINDYSIAISNAVDEAGVNGYGKGLIAGIGIIKTWKNSINGVKLINKLDDKFVFTQLENPFMWFSWYFCESNHKEMLKEWYDKMDDVQLVKLFENIETMLNEDQEHIDIQLYHQISNNLIEEFFKCECNELKNYGIDVDLDFDSEPYSDQISEDLIEENLNKEEYMKEDSGENVPYDDGFDIKRERVMQYLLKTRNYNQVFKGSLSDKTYAILNIIGSINIVKLEMALNKLLNIAFDYKFKYYKDHETGQYKSKKISGYGKYISDGNLFFSQKDANIFQGISILDKDIKLMFPKYTKGLIKSYDTYINSILGAIGQENITISKKSLAIGNKDEYVDDIGEDI